MEKIPPAGPIQADAPGIVPPQRETHEDAKWKRSSTISRFSPKGFAPPPGEVYQRIESPRGEQGWFVASDGSAKPCRVHVRAPSFVQFAGAAEAFRRRPGGRPGGLHRHASTSSWEKWTADAASAGTRTEISVAAGALSRQALGAGAHGAVRAGPCSASSARNWSKRSRTAWT